MSECKNCVCSTCAENAQIQGLCQSCYTCLREFKSSRTINACPKYSKASTNKIIVINGYPQSGKSTFVKLCREINKNCVELSVVDKVKDIAKIAGWNGIKDDKGRKFLSDIKDAMDEYDKLTLKDIDSKIAKSQGKIFFVNAREPKDIQYFVDKYGAKTVFIYKDDNKYTLNHADANVENYDYDFTIPNVGSMEYFKSLAENFLSVIDN